MIKNQFLNLLLLKNQTISKLWQNANHAITKNRTNEALNFFKKISTLTPKTIQEIEYVCLANIKIGKVNQAISILENSLTKFPSDTSLLNQYIILCTEHKQLDRALIQIELHLSDIDTNPITHSFSDLNTNALLSILKYSLSHENKKVAQSIISSIKVDRLNIKSLWELAETLESHYQETQAKELYNEIITRSQENENEIAIVALAAYKLQKSEQAIIELQQGLKRYPNSSSLREHFINICTEAGHINKMITTLLPNENEESKALETLLSDQKNPELRSRLVEHCLTQKLQALTQKAIFASIKDDSGIESLWSLSDRLLHQGKIEDAFTIYTILSESPAKSSLGAMYSGLAAQRLGQPTLALDILESGLREFEGTDILIGHFKNICIEARAFDRLGSVTSPKTSIVHLCISLLEEDLDPPAKINLIDYCLNHKSPELIQAGEKKLEEISYNSTQNQTLWMISDLLEKNSKRQQATEIYKRLATIKSDEPADCFYACLALLRLNKQSDCINLVEEGLSRHPNDHNLSKLYSQICAGNLGYKRYTSFMESIGSQNIVSSFDFYNDFSKNYPIEFLLAIHNIIEDISNDQSVLIQANFTNFLKEHPPSYETAKTIIFVCKYLDLDDEFSQNIIRTITESLCKKQTISKAQERVLQILSELSAPMVSLKSSKAEKQSLQFIASCIKLTNNAVLLQDPLKDVGPNWVPWQLLFCQTEPSLYGDAISAFEGFAKKTWPVLNQTPEPQSGHSGYTSRTNKKIRIGFNVHDSMPMMSGLLTKLNPDLFETIYLRPGSQGSTSTAKQWVERAGKVVEFSDSSTAAAIEKIQQAELDIIVSGPSMGPSFYPLLSKIATLHMILLEPNWTDGITTSDYYVSWLPAEPADPNAFYKTCVAYLRNPPYWIERPTIKHGSTIGPEDRKEARKRIFGINTDARVYLCANTPPKIHREMDEVFLDILNRDEKAVIVFLRDDFPPARTLKARLRHYLGSNFSRLIFLPTLSKDDAHMLVMSADCCLDSFPLCGMSSSFDSVMLGVPLVTYPSEIPFGRWTAAIYDYIGISGLTAKDKQDYVRIALRLAQDPEWREKLSEDLIRKSGRYIESTESAKEFENFLLEAWQRKVNDLPPANWIDGRWQDSAHS